MRRSVLIASFLISATALLADTVQERLGEAAAVFSEIMGTPDNAIPQELLEKAQCVVIVPGLKKGAFVVGGEFGRGFVECRKGNGAGWGAPAAIRMEGGSFGLQLGGSSTDVVMLVMNQRGMDRLLGDKFTIGGEASAAVGPLGRQTSANTDVLLKAEMLSWSRSRGAFAGLSLEGATLRPDNDENRKLYGREITNKEILQTGVAPPQGTHAFIAILNRYSGGPVTSALVTESLNTTGGRLALGEREVHFASGSADIPASAEAVLSEVVNTLKQNASWRLMVEGHTDNVGTKAANQKLSEQR